MVGGSRGIKIKVILRVNMETVQTELFVLWNSATVSLQHGLGHAHYERPAEELGQATWPPEPRSVLHVFIFSTIVPTASRVSGLQAPDFQAGVFGS